MWKTPETGRNLVLHLFLSYIARETNMYKLLAPYRPEYQARFPFQILLLREEGPPYFRVIENKYEGDDEKF
jgi:hypothetical protein